MRNSEFNNLLNECCVLIEMVSNQTKYAQDILGMIDVTDMRVEDDTVTAMTPFSNENSSNLLENIKQLSSKTDRLTSKVQLLVKQVNEFHANR